MVRKMAKANPLWGAPRIHGELLKLGIEISERTVSNLMPPKAVKPPSQTWRAFLKNHMHNTCSEIGDILLTELTIDRGRI